MPVDTPTINHNKVHPHLRTALLIVSISCIYFLFGLLGLQLAVPPSQAGAIWPPAGIALASILLYGIKVWPGIFIGNFCISAWAFGFNEQSIPIYLATGTGATLCACIASILIKKYTDYPSDLINDKEIILFLILGAPVSCLIPATLGLSAMIYSGAISSSEIPLNWVSWWVGDTIGVFIFTPIMLTIFTPNSLLWKRRRLTLGLPLIASFTVVMFFFFYILKSEAERNHQSFQDDSFAFSQTLENRLISHTRIIHSLHNFYISSDKINNTEFQLFTHSFLYDLDEIIGFKYLQYVPKSSTQHKETLIQKANNIKQGFNIPNIKLPQALLSQIINSHLTHNSNQVYLINDHKVIKIFMPIFITSGKDKNSLKGIVVGNISTVDLINRAIQKSHTDHLGISIQTLSNHIPLYTNTHFDSNLLSIDQSIKAANQHWLISSSLDTRYLYSKTHWTLWWVIISGLLFTCLLGSGLLLLTGRYLRTEEIVRNRTAELLTEKNNAESANAAKSQFLSNISHELRTPLNGIIGFSQILIKKPNFSTEDKKQIDIISHCGHHLLTMINDILDISKIESNKITINTEAFDFNELIEDILSISRLEANDKNLTFSVQFTPFQRWVKSDKKRLNQIISNLLTNAIKFTNSGEVKIEMIHKNEHFNFKITDTGCGIPLADQELIFFPFTQIENNNFSEQGIGLGLAISHQLVKLLGGSIAVESTVNQGSIFTFTLPMPLAKKRATTINIALPSTPSARQKSHILIADDNEINIMLLSFMLDAIDCTYDTAINGAKALNFLCTKNYHLAFIDLNMPVLTGLELSDAVRKKNIAVPLIAISAFADKNKINQALSSGFDDYITKPIDENQLKNLINQYV